MHTVLAAFASGGAFIVLLNYHSVAPPMLTNLSPGAGDRQSHKGSFERVFVQICSQQELKPERVILAVAGILVSRCLMCIQGASNHDNRLRFVNVIPPA